MPPFYVMAFAGNLSAMNLPFLTRDVPGIGGVIKQRPEDFFVQEIPLYQASGVGEHVYAEIQKIHITTFDAIDRIAHALNVSSRDIGYAGMKDAHAITRQVLSIPGVSEQAVMDLHLPDITVQWAARHGNKLRLGHLKGNRFAVKIRQVNPTDVVKLTPVIKTLQERGLPNYFGEQRFGRRANNHLVGSALLAGDNQKVLKYLLGDPQKGVDDPQQRGAREAYDRNDLSTSMRLWPRRSGMERRILARRIKTGNDAAAVKAIDEKLRRLFVSALQSELFNQVVAKRIDSLDKVFAGDLAEKSDNGAVFAVEDPAVEQPRCTALEISPTGPMVGYRMTLPTGYPLEIEQAVMEAHGIQPADFRVEGHHKIKGARRALRVRPTDIELASGVDENGPHITVAFTLPAGSFATVLLQEIMKVETATVK